MNDYNFNMQYVYSLRANLLRVSDEIEDWLQDRGFTVSASSAGDSEDDGPGYWVTYLIEGPDLANFEEVRNDFCRFARERIPLKQVVASSQPKTVDILDPVQVCAGHWRLLIKPDESSPLHLFPSTAYWRGDDFEALPEFQRASRGELTPADEEILCRWRAKNPGSYLLASRTEAAA